MPPKSKKLKPKQQRQVRNWFNLPSDIAMNILQRVNALDLLQNARKVCPAWRKICMDPAMWRVIYMESDLVEPLACKKICKLAVRRSKGQLVDITLVRFCDYELLKYVADRSSQVRRLEIACYFRGRNGIWSEPFKKLSSLEELSLVRVKVRAEYIEAAGRCCPLLKTLKVNQKASASEYAPYDYYDFVNMQNEIAVAIGKNLPQLTRLELIGSSMDNIGLQAILDGCCHLESLDLRRCTKLDLNGDLGKRCYQQIKYLKLPHHSLEGYLRTYNILDEYEDECDLEFEYYDTTSEDEYDDYDSDGGGYGLE
ncbi:putative F-box domain, leucine-rich repeat domain superfamily, F-box-like domain superfamily [Helianthus annuus]|nr:putative F-box domain, leucine-rich repeat domain superfamily, F-box-like domain superfamily [Helianthus annuus]